MVIFSRKLAYTSVDAYAQTSSHTRGLVDPESMTPLHARGITVLIPAALTLVSAVSVLKLVLADSPQLLRRTMLMIKNQTREKNRDIKLKKRKDIRPPDTKNKSTDSRDRVEYISCKSKSQRRSSTYESTPNRYIC